MTEIMNQTGNELIHILLQQAARLQRLEYNHDHEHEHDSDHEDHEVKGSVSTAKITAMCVLFIASFVCGCTPFLLNRWFKWTEANGNVRSAIVVKCLLYFGGGVLLCTTFLHLVPEVSHNIESLQECKMLPELSFNLAHLLMCIGFFAMYLVEEVIHSYTERHRKSANSAQEAFKRGRNVRNSFLLKGNCNGKNNGISKQDLKNEDLEGKMCGAKQSEVIEDAGLEKRAPNNQIQMNSGCDSHDHGHIDAVTADLDDDTILSALRGLLIVLALSLHELFEGLAVGLESEPNRVWYMFGAVSAHKLVLAFCVGVELIVTRTKLWLAIVYVTTFAIVSPIGIGIGIYVSSEDNIASAIPSAILQGLASGTLLYVVFFEILSKDRSGLISYAAFVIGFIIMFGIQFAASSSHAHSHGHCGHDHSHGEENGSDYNHSSENMLLTSNEEKLKLIKEATEELAHALANKIK